MNLKLKENKPFFLTTIFIVLTILAIGGIGYGYQHHQMIKEKQAKMKLAEEKKNYIEKINSIRKDILSSSVICEDMINTYTKVWHDVIYNDSVEIDGIKYTDMDEALTAQNISFESEGNLDKLREKQTKIKNEIKSLKKYPKGYKQYYDLIVRYYQTYKQFSDLALSPSGSYQSYTDKTSELDDKLVNQYDELDIKLPSLSSQSE